MQFTILRKVTASFNTEEEKVSPFEEETPSRFRLQCNMENVVLRIISKVTVNREKTYFIKARFFLLIFVSQENPLKMLNKGPREKRC